MARTYGIDISEHNGLYLPAPTPPTPVDYVIQRTSYVGYGSLAFTKDAKIDVNAPPTLASPVSGAYHYVASYTPWKAQADSFISVMKGRYDIWAWDVEKTNNTNASAFISGIVPALEYIYNATKKPGLIYINPDTWATWLQPVQNDIIAILARTDIKIGMWVAHYWNTPAPEKEPNYYTIGGCANMPRDWRFWQYAADATSPLGKSYGVQSTTIDLNVFNGTKEELLKWALPGEIIITPPVEPPVVIDPPVEGSYMNTLDVKYVGCINVP